ncbi:uncharacterized protein LOC122403149 [Colletes gigas]|uniref:uncharacterized protein LOC122403149 n=1 Tax=Colletes gigas TaxID=935657 RepID=UPI001C9BAAB7|nr:uncharacterized protein LOC122403149 [Colletes gigas]
MLTTLWEQVQNFHGCIVSSVPSSEQINYGYFAEDKISVASENYLEAFDYLNDQLALIAPTPLSPIGGHNSTAEHLLPQPGPSATIKLPQLDLPTFNGDFKKWPHFSDAFCAAVKNVQHLSKAQKMQYLDACLRGEPKDLIEHLEICDANFDIAWASLVSEYAHLRVLVSVQLDRLCDLPSVHHDKLDSLKKGKAEVVQSVAALKKLKCPVEEVDFLVVHLAVRRFDTATRRDWENSLGDSRVLPRLEQLTAFLDKKIRALLMTQPHYTGPNVRTHNSVEAKPKLVSSCPFCKSDHPLYACPKFKDINPRARYEFVRGKQACINCLSSKHTSRACPSKFSCKHCRKPHHSLLHFENSNNVTVKPKQPGEAPKDPLNIDATACRTVSLEQETNLAKHAHTSCRISPPTSECPRSVPVLLATALVRVQAADGSHAIVRALIDQGSEATFISSPLAHALNLPRYKVSTTVQGVGGLVLGSLKHGVSLTLSSRSGKSVKVQTNAYVIPNITAYTPPSVSHTSFAELRTYFLADPEPGSQRKIDLLIGANVYGQIIRLGVKHLSAAAITAQKTVFGWILSGPVSPLDHRTHTLSVNLFTTLDSLDSAIRRFWEVEEVPKQVILTPAEQSCEDFFVKTTKRSKDGRFVVKLPFNVDHPATQLGDSFEIAAASLNRLNRRLIKNPPLLKQYTEFINDYKELGHMSVLDSAPRAFLYIPHRGVLRPDSLTTKIRVVFNASSVTANGVALNDLLHAGPPLQQDLNSIILRWRLHRHVLVADVEKMFRQILVDTNDRKFQCILWRGGPSDPVQAFSLNTVTYGLTCAPFLAIRCLQELAKLEGEKYPRAVPILWKNTFMDDVFMGAEDVESLDSLRAEVCGLLAAGKFSLRKWAGNSPELLSRIPVGEHSHAIDLSLFSQTDLKVLGIKWTPQDDHFWFNWSTVRPSDTPLTKRQLLSLVAQLYDPLGWLSPLIIRAKIMMQAQWLEKREWDQAVSENTMRAWNSFCLDLQKLKEIKIPRWLHFTSSCISIELHGFCDASSSAFAAVVYSRVVEKDDSPPVENLSWYDQQRAQYPPSIGANMSFFAPKEQIEFDALFEQCLNNATQCPNPEEGDRRPPKGKPASTPSRLSEADIRQRMRRAAAASKKAAKPLLADPVPPTNAEEEGPRTPPPPPSASPAERTMPPPPPAPACLRIVVPWEVIRVPLHAVFKQRRYRYLSKQGRYLLKFGAEGQLTSLQLTPKRAAAT